MWPSIDGYKWDQLYMLGMDFNLSAAPIITFKGERKVTNAVTVIKPSSPTLKTSDLKPGEFGVLNNGRVVQQLAKASDYPYNTRVAFLDSGHVSILTYELRERVVSGSTLQIKAGG